jgi:hypothetical protein
MHWSKQCPCGSGELSRDLYDARGLFLARVCSDCLDRRMSEFRPEVLTNSNYECDEPIDED